jgi:hypothetical protein
MLNVPPGMGTMSKVTLVPAIVSVYGFIPAGRAPGAGAAGAAGAGAAGAATLAEAQPEAAIKEVREATSNVRFMRESECEAAKG